MSFDFMRAATLQILERASQYEWSMQGFGMLRTYIGQDKRFRLNLWDSSLMVPDVSIIHDHPWHFRSWIISGCFYNERFHVGNYGPEYNGMTIIPGDKGGPDGNPVKVRLESQGRETYRRGATYVQRKDEVHASYYEDGTVTLNDRTPEGADRARVYWLHGDWVDATPRPATPAEVLRTVTRCLDVWHEEL